MLQHLPSLFIFPGFLSPLGRSIVQSSPAAEVSRGKAIAFQSKLTTPKVMPIKQSPTDTCERMAYAYQIQSCSVKKGTLARNCGQVFSDRVLRSLWRRRRDSSIFVGAGSLRAMTPTP